MKLFHSVNISVFIKDEEDYDSIKENFIGLFPFNLEEARVNLSETNASTFNDRTIRILEVRLERNRQINDFMKAVKEKLSITDREMMIKQINTRLDDNLDFFFRLSKSELIEEGKCVVVDDGNCYHFKCHIATFPQNKKKAKELIQDFLS